MKFQALQSKREAIAGKVIVGIDPAKKKHQVAILDPQGVQLSHSFAFDVSYEGYSDHLWKKVTKILPTCNPQSVIFAVETSCNLWQTIAFTLHQQGYTVLLVSPLTTYHTRPMISHEFSRTDPKDALLVASNAQHGYYDRYVQFSPHCNAMHRLSITYTKLRNGLAQNRARLRALVEQIFPEFLTLIAPNTRTAQYLLRNYLFPHEFLAMNIHQEAGVISKLSRRQYGLDTLQELQRLAQHSFGVKSTGTECLAERLSLNSWIALIETYSAQMKHVLNSLLQLANQLPEFEYLQSLTGVSSITSALFLAEARDLRRYRHYKQLEKYAGLNLRQCQSGQYVGARRISHLGNNRLRWILYTMTEETAKWIPEVRIKYLTRQIKRRNHRKNIVASTPQLLKLIMTVVKEQRPYEHRPETEIKMKQLEKQYHDLKQQKIPTIRDTKLTPIHSHKLNPSARTLLV